MKKFILIGLTSLLVASCQKQQYTQQSDEIETYKKVVEAYEKQDWKNLATHYADTAKILNNVSEKSAQNLAQFQEQNEKDAAIFTNFKYVPSESEYEMVVTDKGETWVNFWGLWRGTLKANNKVYEIPTAITARFIDGKIVRELGYWDSSKLVSDIQKIEAEKSTNTIQMDK